MRSPTCHPRQGLGRRFKVFGFLCPAILALAAGCAQLRSAAPPVNCAVCGGAPCTAEPPTATPAPEEEPAGRLLPPVKELPPIGKLDVDGNDFKEQVPTVPPPPSPEQKSVLPAAPETLPDTLPEPKTPAAPVEPGGQEQLPPVQSIGQEQLPPVTESRPVEGIGFSIGDPNKLVLLNLDTLLQLVEKNCPGAEAILEASGDYLDLLAARAALAVAMQTAERLDDLLKQANAMVYERLPFALEEVPHIQAELENQQADMAKCREAAIAVAARMRGGLGLDPGAGLGIAERQLIAYPLVNADIPAEVLIARAQRNGPGVREMDVQLTCCQECCARECNRGALCSAAARRQQQCMAENQLRQVEAACQEARAKLSMDVQETRKAVLSARDQLESGLKKLSAATVAYESARDRLAHAANTWDRSPAQVLTALRTLQALNLSYVTAISDFDKAQVRLAVLTGDLGGAKTH
jgi:hypothetical protein